MSDEEQVATTVHTVMGGDRFFFELAERFYAGVADDAELLSIYPDPDDLTDAKRHLALFLIQYWGGDHTYMAERGHPRLRMRHVPFTIGPAERDAWLRHMTAALDSLCAERDYLPEAVERIHEYFAMSAEAMRNSDI